MVNHWKTKNTQRIGTRESSTSLAYSGSPCANTRATSCVVTTVATSVRLYAASVGLKKQPRISTARIGPTLESATRPKLSFAAFLSLRTDARPTPIAIINGTVIGPVVTPPESNATARNSLGTNTDTKISAR